MPPLFVPAQVSTFPLQISRLNQKSIFWKLVGLSTAAASNTVINNLSEFRNGEMIVCGDDNKIGFVTNLRQAKINRFPAFPVGAPFTAGVINQAFRSIASGNIYANVNQTDLAKSTDNGVSWSDITPPAFVGDTIRGMAELANGRLWCQKEGASTIDIAFSDDAGTTWTVTGTGLTSGGTARRAPIMNRDRSRIVFVGNSTGSLSWTTTLGGAPVINPVDLTAITGQTSGPGPFSDFDDSGGFFGFGDFGDYIYTADFVNFSLIDDLDNPMVKGNNVGATVFTGGGYYRALDAFIVGSKEAGVSPGTISFYPRETITDPTTYQQISMDRTLSTSAAFGKAQSDDNGNIWIAGSQTDNIIWTNLLSEL